MQINKAQDTLWTNLSQVHGQTFEKCYILELAAECINQEERTLVGHCEILT